MSEPTEKHDELRRRALLVALSRRGGDPQELLSWHPEREAFEHLEPIVAADCRDFLFEELSYYEENIPAVFRQAIDTENSSRVHFWRRRWNADRGRRWRVAQERLPPFWLGRLELPTHRMGNHCQALGAEFLLAAAHGQSKEELVRFLRPLGGVFVRSFVKKLKQRTSPPEPEELRRKWQRACSEVTHRWGERREKSRGERIASALGIRMLATLFRRLPPEDRRLAAQISVSNICTLMENAEPLAHLESEEMEALERICSSADREGIFADDELS